jgi:hypothetical protein
MPTLYRIIYEMFITAVPVFMPFLSIPGYTYHGSKIAAHRYCTGGW